MVTCLNRFSLFRGFPGLRSFSCTKQNLVGIEPGFKLILEEPGLLAEHSASKCSPQILTCILECSFTGVFVRRIFASHLESSSLFSSGKRCQDPLLASVSNTPSRHFEKKRTNDNNNNLIIVSKLHAAVTTKPRFDASIKKL